jgi:hypothetical protein
MLGLKKIKNFFFKKKKNKNIIFNKKPKEGFAKKRKNLKINFEFLKHFKFLKRKYVPYFFI